VPRGAPRVRDGAAATDAFRAPIDSSAPTTRGAACRSGRFARIASSARDTDRDRTSVSAGAWRRPRAAGGGARPGRSRRDGRVPRTCRFASADHSRGSVPLRALLERSKVCAGHGPGSVCCCRATRSARETDRGRTSGSAGASRRLRAAGSAAHLGRSRRDGRVPRTCRLLSADHSRGSVPLSLLMSRRKSCAGDGPGSDVSLHRRVEAPACRRARRASRSGRRERARPLRQRRPLRARGIDHRAAPCARAPRPDAHHVREFKP
jgi:hypothetical protein